MITCSSYHGSFGLRIANCLPLSTNGITSFALKLNSARSLIHFACNDSASASAGVFKRPPVTSPVTTNLYHDPPSNKIFS